ncbi:MAG: PHP domain-containing protein [Coriobacteriia bacterium]|nr:PHP domain-containing protein [Coriobacteriia bacterium]
MRLRADLHTHTIASGHAFSTVTEVAEAARAGDLDLIAITDHGPSVPGGADLWYFWNLKVVPSILDGVRIVKGCEANLSPDACAENGIDIPDAVLELLDIVAVGFHPLTGFDDKDAGRNTEALLRVVANPLVDMLTHPGNGEFPIDAERVVEAAVQHRVVLEINAHSFASSSSRAAHSAAERHFAELAREAGAVVAIGSDAHYHLHVGRFDDALSVAEQLGYVEGDILNRSAEAVLEFLLSKRPRPRLDFGGEWRTGGDAP